MPAVAEASAADALVVLGKIVAPYGLRGAVKVHPFADDPQAWARLPRWRLGREADGPEAWREVRVLRCRLSGDVLIAELDGIVDRDASEAAQGLLVGVPRAELPAAGTDEYYWADLVGLDVVNSRAEPLGQVLGLIETTANDVLRVGSGEGEDAKERLLPFVAAVVKEVDLPGRRIVVEWEADW